MSDESQKIEAICPECGTKNEVLYFPKKFISFKGSGTTGISGNIFNSRQSEKVIGNCKECNYKFKPDDL
jgi:rubredoxin|tara:strand:+ start:526 stop:732 length:207 start_codon:yes stop_codon:yes gene_type:complete